MLLHSMLRSTYYALDAYFLCATGLHHAGLIAAAAGTHMKDNEVGLSERAVPDIVQRAAHRIDKKLDQQTHANMTVIEQRVASM